MADYNINEKYSIFDRAKASINRYVLVPLINTLNLNVDDYYKDKPVATCNNGLSHTFRRKNEMTASENAIPYKGVKSTKVGSQIVTEHTVLKERLRSIDEIELLGMDEAQKKEELKNQDEAHIRQLGEDGVYADFHGGLTASSENIRGFYERLSSLNPDGLNNVLSLGNDNASYNSSIFIIEWTPTFGCYGLVPNNSMGRGELGVRSHNEGRVSRTNPDDSERTYMALEARHYLTTGIGVGDNLKIARLGNINTDEDGANNFISGKGSRKLFKILENGHFDISRTRIYVNPDIMTQIQILGNEKSNVTLSSVEVFGKRVKAFQLVPIRVLDKVIIPSNETVIS